MGQEQVVSSVQPKVTVRDIERILHCYSVGATQYGADMCLKILLFLFAFYFAIFTASKKYKRKKIKIEYEYLPKVIFFWKVKNVTLSS